MAAGGGSSVSSGRSLRLVPEGVARCIIALCHPATYWMTGNTLHVDGGENVVG
jgi:NAD(P)-dependent dehydrogenase (short-subunit alcohol dehydrogenase family)